MSRRTLGTIINVGGGHNLTPVGSGVFSTPGRLTGQAFVVGGDPATGEITTVTIDNARVVPVGAANKPRAWGALACAYLGQPAL